MNYLCHTAGWSFCRIATHRGLLNDWRGHNRLTRLRVGPPLVPDGGECGPEEVRVRTGGDVHAAAVDVRGVLVGEETLIYDEVVHLRYLLVESIMFLQEPKQLLRRSIDGHLVRVDVFLVEHVVEKLPAQSATLSRLVHVKVQHAGRRHIHRLAILVKHVQGFTAHFQNTDNESMFLIRLEHQIDVVVGVSQFL